MTGRRDQVFKMLQSLVLVIFARDSCHSVHGVTAKTEEFTVWPKNNGSRLPEDYPWPSCDKTTGSQCPGLIDYFEHFCTREDNQGCQKRNESVSERNVLLNLLPGRHTMDLWENFYFHFVANPYQHFTKKTMYGLRPGHFWFCRVSMTIKGNNMSETFISLTNHSHRYYGQQNSSHEPACTLEHEETGPSGALWSAFAFRGGGSVRFQDIVFQTKAASSLSTATSQRVYRYQTHQSVITVWDIAAFEMVRCRFPEMLPAQGALVALYSDDVTSFSLRLKKCDFQSHFTRNYHWPRSSFPFVSIASTLRQMDKFNDKISAHISSKITSEVLLESCTFLARCMDFIGYQTLTR